MSKIVLLFGRKGSGKDTAADGLCAAFPGTFRYALAEPIREFLKLVFGWTDAQLSGSEKDKPQPVDWTRAVCNFLRYERSWRKSLGLHACAGHDTLSDWFFDMVPDDYGCPEDCQISPRQCMQTLGTDWGRAHDPDLWIRLGIRACERALAEGAPLAVITDGRFENEVRCVLAAGGNCIKIERPGLPLDVHESEAGQDRVPEGLFGSIVQNEGTVDGLQEAVARAVRRYV